MLFAHGTECSLLHFYICTLEIDFLPKFSLLAHFGWPGWWTALISMHYEHKNHCHHNIQEVKCAWNNKAHISTNICRSIFIQTTTTKKKPHEMGKSGRTATTKCTFLHTFKSTITIASVMLSIYLLYECANTRKPNYNVYKSVYTSRRHTKNELMRM